MNDLVFLGIESQYCINKITNILFNYSRLLISSILFDTHPYLRIDYK